ncbi:MAG: hypothetical protein HY830_00685 [Actinobacteria bacterium]|nr:hypothetical protein [Actinomycetota bacterium]
MPFVDGYLAFGPDWRSSSGWGSAWTLVPGLGLLVGVAHGLRLLTTAHLRLAETLLGPDPAQRLAAVQRAVERADARERLARDLHDGLGHALTLVVVQAEAAATALDDRPDAARTHLAAVTEAARRALGDLDRALDHLHGGPSPHEPGIDDVPELVRVARVAGLDIALTGPGGSAASHGPVAGPVSGAAYRVVQEALTNALRHSASQSASVVLDHGGEGLRVTVRTPGTAPVRQRGVAGGPGRGLAGLRDRVGATGGTIAAGPGSGEFVVEAVWPHP